MVELLRLQQRLQQLYMHSLICVCDHYAFSRGEEGEFGYRIPFPKDVFGHHTLSFSFLVNPKMFLLYANLAQLRVLCEWVLLNLHYLAIDVQYRHFGVFFCRVTSNIRMIIDKPNHFHRCAIRSNHHLISVRDRPIDPIISFGQIVIYTSDFSN